MTTNQGLGFVDGLLKLLDATDPVGGETYLKRHPLDDLIHSSQQPSGFRPFFTDDELAQIIRDRRIDWMTCYVASQDSSDRVSLLSHLIHHMEMNQYLTWLPSTAKALNERYTPSEQVCLLKRCEAMPGGNGSLVDGRHLLAGRIVPLILQSDVHVNAWVDAWFTGIKNMEGRVSILESFSKVNPVTRLYKKLPKSDDWLSRIPMLMTLAGALDHEMVMASVSRYTPASLYDICSGDFTGHLNMCGSDFARRNLSYGLFLLQGSEALELSKALINGVTRDKHFELASSILAVSVNFNSEDLPIAELSTFKDTNTGQTALDNALQEHAFSWVSDWFQKLAANEKSDVLRELVFNADRFETWCAESSRRNRSVNIHGSLATLKKLKAWVSLLSETDQDLCLSFAIEKFQMDISSRSKYGKGILFAKILLSVFPDKEMAQDAIKGLFSSLIKRSLTIKDKEIVNEVVKHGLVSLPEIGKKISTLEEFNLITGVGGLDRDELRQHVNLALKGRIFTNEMGV